ncbi:alpha/beta fold hydrolase [Eilatimonas milleporae]|nr:alpha/beta fold hydrolase [Eilatimonas milleporae]
MPTLTTADGTLWGYGRSGRAGGRPVLVHHGLIGDAALDPRMTALGEDHGLEWIVIERPGYGQTPPMAMDRIADWPAMIAPVLEALGITGRFDAVGVSAGAPYTYALSAGMADRAGRLCILSGVPFIGMEAVLAAYPEDGQASYARYATAGETALRDEFRIFCETMAARFADHAGLSAALTAILAQDVAGPAREARLQARDWGFPPGAVRCPVDLWHAQADDLVPYAAARLSADGLPNAAWHIQADPSHMASDATLREMAERLAQPEG